MLKQLFFTVGVPVLVASVVLLGAYLLYIFTDSWRPMDWGGAAGFGLPFFISFCLINGSIPPFPPADSVNWIPYVALLTVFLSPFEREVPVSSWMRWAGRMLLVSVALTLLLYPVLKQGSTGMALAWLGGGSMSILLIWAAVIELDERMEGYVFPLAFLFCSTFASVLLVTTFQYGSMAQYAGSFSAVCGVFCGFSLLNRSRSILGGARPAIMLLFPMMLLGGWFYATNVQGGSWPFLLLAGLPVFVGIVYVPAVHKRFNRLAREISGVVAIVLAGLVLSGLVWFAQQPSGSSGSGSDTGEKYEDYGY